MALSISNPLSSIHIDPNFRFYKLSIPERRIINCDDKHIVDYFHDLHYMHCSLCLAQENGSGSIYQHLTSETHALNGMRSSNFVGFLIEEMAALIICKRENINYFFYLHFKAFPYEMGMGIADLQFVTIMNKITVSKKNSKVRVSLGDFDLNPEKITNKFSLTVLIENGDKSARTLFTQNFLLYDLMYSVQSKKYFLKTANIWRYLNNNDNPPNNIVCSCKNSIRPGKFENHLETTKCSINAGIYCHLCSTLTLFSSGQFLTHVHSQVVNTQFEKMKISDTSEESPKIIIKKSNEDTAKKFKKMKQEVHIKYKMPATVEEQCNKSKVFTQVNSKIDTNKKKETKKAISLSLAILGNVSSLQATQLKTLIENFKVHIYCCEKKELNVCRLDELSTIYHISVVVCCICMKICTSDSSLLLHVKTGDHNRKLVKCLPSAVFFPEIGELVICKIQDLNYLQHVMFKETYLLSNITVGDSNSIFITFYNFKLKNELFKSPTRAVLKDDVKSRIIGCESNSKFRLIRLKSDGSPDNSNALKVFPQSFIIFEFFSDTKNCSEDNDIVSLEMSKFLTCLKGYKISCVPCGRKKLKCSTFTKHMSGSKFNCGKNCIGVLCHQCLTFSIQPCQDCVRHNHEIIKNDKKSEHHQSRDKNKSVKHVDIELYEKIDIKEYFNIVNPLRIFKEINHIKSLTNYLLKALPLKSNINKVTFSCNTCSDWQGFHMRDILKHTTSPSHVEENHGKLEEYSALCDICHVFLLDSTQDLLDNHIKTNHPEYTSEDNDFSIIQDESHITINLITEFSYNLLESFVGKIGLFLNIENNELLVFCMVCFTEFYYSLENFHNHIMQSTHQPQTNDHFSAYCKFCKLLLYSSDIKCITNHFNYHSYLINTKISTIGTSDNVIPPPIVVDGVLPTPIPISIFDKIVVFSSSYGQGNHSKLALSEFEYLTSVEVIKLFNSCKSKYIQRNEGKTFYFTCLQCNLNGIDENECNRHFLSRVHRLKLNEVELYFASVCDDCGILLIGTSTYSFSEHFDAGSHFLNEIYRAIDSNQHLLSTMTDKERITVGYVTKLCEDTFSSKEKYDKFVEVNLLEFMRAERGLRSLCNSLTNDIRRVLSRTYPNAKLHFFGSRISGLAKIKSDIDIFIDVGTEDLERLVPFFTTIPGLFHIKQVILGAKVPIIKLEHKNTGLSCDISCQDGYGVYNTHLINPQYAALTNFDLYDYHFFERSNPEQLVSRLYINLDERIYKICATVLEWAKMNGIRGSPKFTSYSLTWMVIFFLMQPEISLVPSVQWLQERYLGRKVIINGWNCSFLNDINLIKKYFVPKNSGMTLHELVYNFFFYYAMLRAETVVLFPYSGEVISNRSLSRYSKAPVFLRNIFFDNNGDKLLRRGSFRLMDPFILTCNIVQNIRKNELKLFQALCVHTVRNLNWVKKNS